MSGDELYGRVYAYHVLLGLLRNCTIPVLFLSVLRDSGHGQSDLGALTRISQKLPLG